MQQSTDWQTLYPSWAAEGLIPLRRPGETFVDRTNKTVKATGKEPVPHNWQTVHAQRRAVAESRDQTLHDMALLLTEGYNVGIVIPEGCVVLDWDCPKNVSPAAIEKTQAEILALFPDAPCQATQSNGLHLWFRVLAGEEFTATTKAEIQGFTFDIRSGGRSQVVVAPSTGLRGAYSWLRPLPPDISMLPKRPLGLLEFITSGKGKEVQRTNYGPMPSARPEKPTAAKIEKLQTIDPDLYKKILAGSPLSAPGDRNNAMTRAVGLILGTMTAHDKPPHPEHPFELLYRCIDSDRTIGQDGGMPPTLEELWDVCCRMTDRERPDWQARKNILEGLNAIRARQEEERLAEHVDGRKATAALCMIDEEQLLHQVLLIDMAGKYWVLDTELQGYHGPLHPQTVLKFLHDKGGHILPMESFYNQQGKMRPIQELIRDFGQQIGRIWYDSRVQAPIYNPRDGALVRPAWKWRHLEPEYNTFIDHWLRALNGDQYETLCDWLASVPFVQYPTSCLYLHGPSGVGKTLLVEGLSKLWEAPPVPFRQAVADFNSGILGSPLIFIEEGLATDTDSLRFRDILTAEVHDIRVKYEAPGELHGHVRMVVAANNPNALRIREDLTHSDRDAISRRILWIDTGDEARHYLTSIGGRKVTEDWVSNSGFARHVLWLHQQRGQQIYERMDRLLVPGNSSSQKTRMLLTHRIPRSTLRIIVQALQDDAYGKNRAPGMLNYTDGTVEAHWAAIYAVWSTNEGRYGRTPTVDMGERALESLAQSARVVLVQGEPRKTFTIDRGILLEEIKAVLDGAAVKRVSLFLENSCKLGNGNVN